MLNNEAGPGDVFLRFRTWLGVRYDKHSNPYGENWRAKAILCPYCLSVWVALGVWLFVLIFTAMDRQIVAVHILFPFALSGGAVYLKKQAG